MDMIEKVARAIRRVTREIHGDDVDASPAYTPSDLLYARAAIAAIYEWQPIETAPKDGTVILLCGGEDDPLNTDAHPNEALHTRPVTGWWGRVVEWDEADTIWRYCSYDSGIYGEYKNPTHWMPLPPPPKATPASE